MRVISGKYKGRVIDSYNIDGTRPTMDRVKESLFGIWKVLWKICFAKRK